jgi:hypothetical protein
MPFFAANVARTIVLRSDIGLEKHQCQLDDDKKLFAPHFKPNGQQRVNKCMNFDKLMITFIEVVD